MTVITTRGLLFDCDGVLVDSDASVVSAWTRWTEQYDLDPTAVTAMVHGRRSADTVAALLPAHHVPTALALIDRYEIEDAAGVTALPGAAAMLTSLPPGTWAVVTSGVTALATARLTAAGLCRLILRGSADVRVHVLGW
jgi:sugar-phosphatase